MPMMDLSYPEGALSPEGRADVVEKLTHALLRNEGATTNRQTLGMSWVYVHELPDWAVNVGGHSAVRPIYRLMVTVPRGTLLEGPGPVGLTSKRNLIREATEIILAGEGTPYSPQESLRVMVLVREIEDAYWGGFGTTIRMEDIVSIVEDSAEPTQVSTKVREVMEDLLDQQLGSAEPARSHA